MTVGEKIKSFREKMGLSQSDIANALNVKQNTVSGWERGYREPSRKTIAALATIFDINIEMLMADDEDHEDELLFLEELKKATEVTAADLKEKYNFVVDGRPASDEEIEGMIAYIRAVRSLKE